MKFEDVFFPFTRFAMSMMLPDKKDEGSILVLGFRIIIGIFMVPTMFILDCIFMPILLLMHLFGR